MSCVTTATATQFSTVTSEEVTTTFSSSVTTLPTSSLTTIVTSSCSAGAGSASASSDALAPTCTPVTTVSTISSNFESTVQVPIQVTIPVTSTIPTATLFATDCASNAGSSSSPSSSSSSSLSSSSSQSSSTSSSSVILASTTVLETTTLPGGFVITTDVVSTYTVIPSSGPTNAHSSSNTGAIVGGVVGGVVGLALFLLLFWACRRTRSRHDAAFRYDDSDVLAPQMVQQQRDRNLDILDSEARPYPYSDDATSHDQSSSGDVSRAATYPYHSPARGAVERSASTKAAGAAEGSDAAARPRRQSQRRLQVANQAGIGRRDIKDPGLYKVAEGQTEPAENLRAQPPYVHEDSGVRLQFEGTSSADATSVPPPVYTAD